MTKDYETLVKVLATIRERADSINLLNFTLKLSGGKIFGGVPLSTLIQINFGAIRRSKSMLCHKIISIDER